MMYLTEQQNPITADKTPPVFFAFEEDFIEDEVRCIPMIVRFKLDACGIKLKLAEWSRMTLEERVLLAEMRCSDTKSIHQYRRYLQQLIKEHTGGAATELNIEANPSWANRKHLPTVLVEKLDEFGWMLSTGQWSLLTDLQRFVLLKLCRPGHENKNFPKAMQEFALI